MRAGARPRPGFGLIMVIAVLAITAILLSTITAQILTNRRAVATLERQRQAVWLARGGMEFALPKLEAAPAEYPGETVDFGDLGRARIEVRRSKDMVHLTSVAALDSDAIVREEGRRFQLVGEGKSQQLEPRPSIAP